MAVKAAKFGHLAAFPVDILNPVYLFCLLGICVTRSRRHGAEIGRIRVPVERRRHPHAQPGRRRAEGVREDPPEEVAANNHRAADP